VTGIRHLVSRDYTARPWRNGGGVTRDIVAVPAGTSDDDFLWRASIATIDAAGPFSLWPGVDRAFLLLRGELLLTVGNEGERPVDSNAAAILFAGEAAIAARPVGGPCTALNLMTRRGRARIAVERWTAARPTAAGQCLLLAEQPTTLRINGDAIDLGQGDALLLTGAVPTELEFDRPLIVAEIFI
jgi:environmental stress-induced protein Ves